MRTNYLTSSFPTLRFFLRATIIIAFCCTITPGRSISDAHAAPSPGLLLDLPPSISLNVPDEAFIGTNITFSVTFDNVNTVEGYGPLIDLILPTNGADGAQNTNPPLDGLTFLNATYLGVNVENTVLTFPGSGGVTCVDHPYMVDNTGNPVQVCGDAGDTFVALRLPFGSFTPDQPPVEITVTVSMSNLADLSVPLVIQARGGYQFGYTPLNDWCCGDDPSLSLSSWTSDSLTPTLFTLEKSYNGPEDETATGPNFPRQYTVTATIAPGQTISPFTLTDTLPNNMQFVSLVSTSPGSASCTTPSTVTPGGTLSCDFASVSGTVTMTFEYYIPLRDAGGGSVIDPTSGDDALSCNNASGGGTWTPIDPRDTGGTFTQNPAGCEHTLTDKSIAIQKDVSVVGGGGVMPGKYLEYTLDFQISDFFAFNGVVINDTISDGQHFDSSFAPTLEINGNTYTLIPAAFNAANYEVTCNYTGGPGPECTADNPAANDGTTTLTFRVSDEIITRGQDGRLIGGCVPTTGTGGGDPDCGTYNDGPTTGRVIFRTLIQQDFTDDYPSGDPSVDQGDTLDNMVIIEGTLLSTDDASTPTGYAEDDDSAATSVIGRGPFTKSVYAVNGNPAGTPPIEVKPGDEVTYRLTYILPTGDVEDLELDDYLPLPVFHVGDPNEDGSPGPAWTFDPTVSAAAPPAGVAKFGPSDTFYYYSSIIPSISINILNNRLNFFYGDFDGTSEAQYTVDILFTVTVSDDPFADRLYLTNQAHAFEGSTNAGTAEANAIVQIILTEPVLVMKKGIIWTDNPNATFDPTPPGPVTFLDPTNSPRWSGIINSTNLAAHPIDSDITGVDAGDIVTFAIVIENTGSSGKGAFDIRIRDDLPAGFVIPGGSPGLNLQVYRGDGTPLSYTDLGGGLFGTGIEISDPSPAEGACEKYDPNNGKNIVLVTFDLQLGVTIQGGQILTNTATLFNYAGSEGGPNHLPEPLKDDADTQIRYDSLGKTFTTEIIDSYNSQTQVVIGEYIDYTLTITFHEGTAPNVTLEEQLPSGLAFVDCLSITPSPGLSTDLPGGFASACNDPTNPNVSSPGQNFTFTLGTITNSNTDNTVDETLSIVFRAVTLNVIGNQAGTDLINRATLVIDGGAGGTATVQSAPATVIEPVVNTTKFVVPTTADAGDIVTFTVTLTNPASGSTTAYDVTWSDAVPSGLTYVPGSLALGTCTASTPPTLSDAGAPTLTGSGGLFQPGESCTITFRATVDYSVIPGQPITNTAQTRWTSIPGVRTDYSPYNTDSDERTGEDGLLDSGVLNDYRTEGSATLTINAAAPEKSLVTTSEAHTGVVSDTANVTIGEIVRYRLVVQLPEGTSPNFQIRDNLPAGLTYLDDGTARLALLSNGAPIASTEPTGSTLGLALGNGPFGSDPWVNGNDPTLVTPTFPLPDQNVGSSNSLTADPDTYNTGTDPFFKLGTLTNNDSDADAEYVIIEFNALVDNTATGSNDAGDNRNNTFSVFINGTQNGPNSNTVTVRIAEPLLTLAKAVATAPVDAGDPITYTLTISAASGANRSTAFDLVLSDTFDAYLIGLSVTNVTTTQGATCVGNGAGTTPFSHNGGSFAGNTLTFTATCLDPGQTITVTVTGTVTATAPVGYVIPNTANLVYTSLPGPNGTTSNPTGSTTPGASGADNGERDGSDGVGGAVDDYAATGSASAPLATPLIDKLNPVPTQYAIGQQVTFNILITLPEGLTPALNVVDNLPTGLQYVSHQVITSAAASGGILAADYNGSFTNAPPTFTCSGTCASGDDITLDFGDTTTNADNVTNNNAFLVQVVAVVVNESSNQNGTVLTNTATVSWTGGSASDSVNVSVIEPELDLAKSVDDDTPAYGQILTYTLTVSHLPTSTTTAYDIVITDTIPSGLTYVLGSISAPAGWTSNDSSAPTLTWTCVAPCSLPVGDTAMFTYQVSVASTPPPNPGDTLTNTASMTWTSTDGANPDERTGSGGINDYSDSTSQTVTLTYPDLTVTKTDGQSSYVPGAPVVYTIVVSNVGNGDAIGATVSDNIPPQIISWSWVCTAQTGGATGCDPYSGNGNFTDVVDLPAGASITYTITAQTDPAATTDLTNTVTVTPPTGITEPTPDDNTASDTDTPNYQADLSVTKDDGVAMYIPGDTLTYTIVVSNAGPSNAPGSLVTDAIPPQFTSWSWACTAQSGGATGCDPYSGSGNFSDTVDLPAGSSITYTVTAQVSSSATGNLTNTVTVTPPAGVTDPTPGNNTASDTDAQNSQAAISVTKDDGVTEYIPGGTLTYTITVTNTGPSDALGVSVTDNIPPQFTSWTWTCVGSTGGASGCTDSGGPMSTDFTDSIDLAGPFPSSITYQVMAQVASSASGNLTNTVTISHPADSTPDDNIASDTDTPNYQADLYVIKDDGSATYTPGVGVTYTVTIGNNGPSDVTGAMLTDNIPAQATSWMWTCSGSTGGASGCDGYGPGNANFSDTVDLPASSSITYTVTVDIPSSATGDLVNTATITPPGGVTDLNPDNNSDTDTDTQNSQAAISITKDDGVIEYIPGGTLTYTITITNTGPSDALEVSVSDPKPPQITSWEWTCLPSGGATCNGSGGPITTDFNETIDLPAGASVTYTVVAQVASSATGDLTNTVTISHPADSTPDDNTASDTDTPNYQADLSVTKDDGVTVVSPGATITYTITVSNAGPSDAPGSLVTDPIPPQFSSWTWICGSVSGGASGCDGVINSTDNFSDTVDLPAGSTITYLVIVQLSEDANGTLVNQVSVTPAEDVFDNNPDNNDEDDDDRILSPTDGDFIKALISTNQDFTPNGSVAIGEILTYQIIFTVPAGGLMPSLTLVDTLDRGLAFVGCESISVSDPAITTSLPGGFAEACNDPINPTVSREPPDSDNPADEGRKISFNLGDVSNSISNDGVVIIRYQVVVLNSLENRDGVLLNNYAELTWASGSLSTSATETLIVEPDLEVIKQVDRTVVLPGSTVLFTLTIRHTTESHTDAFNVVLEDVLPDGLTYVADSLTILSGPPGGVVDDSAAPTLRVTWPTFPLLTGENRTEAVVQFEATVGNLPAGTNLQNIANLVWSSLPEDVSEPQSPYNDLSTERGYEALSEVNIYQSYAEKVISIPLLPETGFAPGQVTDVPAQPAEKAYADLGEFWLEIPRLGVQIPIVGVPARGSGWDLTWLWNRAGWLEGTAYPTHSGNSAITAHVYLPNGQPGPFWGLGELHYGDQIIIHLAGQRYIYEVRQVQQVSPYSLSALRHEEYSWLTLITCREYNEATNSYRYRILVRAVLVKVEAE